MVDWFEPAARVQFGRIRPIEPGQLVGFGFFWCETSFMPADLDSERHEIRDQLQFLCLRHIMACLLGDPLQWLKGSFVGSEPRAYLNGSSMETNKWNPGCGCTKTEITNVCLGLFLGMAKRS